MTYTKEEINDYIKNNLSFLELTNNEIKRYSDFIEKRYNYIKIKYKNTNIDVFEEFENKLEETYSFFIKEGYTEDKSISLTKNAILLSDRKDYVTRLNFIRTINSEEEVLEKNILFFAKRINEFHARKAYLVSINKAKEQTINNIFKITNEQFEKKYSIKMNTLIEKFPMTEEVKKVWSYQANLTNDELTKEFGLTREQLSLIYPTTKDELETIKMIGKSTNNEIINKYGINKDALLKKYPLNRDTLIALLSIKKAKDTTVEKLFSQPKEEVLKLRTITTEMIQLANQKIKLKYYTKEELKEKLMSKKRESI